MSDQEILEENESDGEESGKKKKKGGSSGIAKLLPTLLKFAGIALGAVILIISVSVITYNLLSKGGKQQTSVPITESYLGTKPQYQMFRLIGPITTRLNDSYTVRVDMIIGYDENDTAAGTEFTARQDEIRDFLRRYFRAKTSGDLRPENEEQVKRELREQLNTQILDKARVRVILFNTFDVMETG
jgi:flagellar FliL protein